jgi:hypothetical protein
MSIETCIRPISYSEAERLQIEKGFERHLEVLKEEHRICGLVKDVVSTSIGKAVNKKFCELVEERLSKRLEGLNVSIEKKAFTNINEKLIVLNWWSENHVRTVRFQISEEGNEKLSVEYFAECNKWVLSDDRLAEKVNLLKNIDDIFERLDNLERLARQFEAKVRNCGSLGTFFEYQDLNTNNLDYRLIRL